MRTAPTVGDLLRHWRQAARRSQLDLASVSGVSARHLSFVETGRARASRELLLHLAEHLEMPLRERNALVLAAGYAPAYAESDLGAEHLRSAREALAHLLAGFTQPSFQMPEQLLQLDSLALSPSRISRCWARMRTCAAALAGRSCAHHLQHPEDERDQNDPAEVGAEDHGDAGGGDPSV